MKESCAVCGSYSEERSTHHLIPTALGGSEAGYNLLMVGRNCHDLIHFVQHPDTLFERVRRVKQGSARHRKFLKFVSHLSDPVKRDRIFKLREIISLASSSVGHKERDILESVFPGWVSRDLWKSSSPLRGLSPLSSPSEYVPGEFSISL